MANPRCIRSIKHHYKKGRGRSAAPVIKGKLNRKQSDTVTNDKEAELKNAALFSDIDEKPKTSKEPKNSLIDEKALKTKIARINKEIELRKHVLTVNSLKRKLAK